MNDSELDQKLKAAREPARDARYPEEFTQSVLKNLRSAPWQPAPARPAWPLRLAWSFAAVVVIVAAFALGHRQGKMELASSEKGPLENAKLIHETMAMFPNQVRAIVQDEHGMKLVLADQADVPDSQPLYVRICDGKTCSSMVTFSGQEIQIAGQKLTVLADATGGIILEGSQFAWSSTQKTYAQNQLKIEARAL